MVDQTYITFFDKAYDDTYKKTLLYVTKKCGNACDIADILQETYAEFYTVIVKKGIQYIKNPEALIMRIAKTKTYRYYSLKERAKDHIPFFTKSEDDSEYEAGLISDENSVEDITVNNLMLEQISQFIKSKASDVQRIFYLYFYLEMTITQIAKELSIKESTVKSKLFRTLKEVRAIYGKDGAFR